MGKRGVIRRPAVAPVFLKVESLFAHDVYIRARIAHGEGHAAIARQMLADMGLLVKSCTIRNYMKRFSGETGTLRAAAYSTLESLFVHDVYIRSRIACGECYTVIARNMLADKGLLVKPGTMQAYMRLLSGETGKIRCFQRGDGRVTRYDYANYLSISQLGAHDATISCIIDADPFIGYKALATKLADLGIDVKLESMKRYMQRLSGSGVTYLSSSQLAAHDAIISAITDADPAIGYKALVTKLAESGIHVRQDTMKEYMKRASYMKSRVTYLSMSELKDHEATISSIIDADPSLGYKAVVSKLAASGIHVKPKTMENYMLRVIRASLRDPVNSKHALDSSQIDSLRNLFVSPPGASASVVQADSLSKFRRYIRFYIDRIRLESMSSSRGTGLPRMRGKQRPPPHLSLTSLRPLAIRH